MSMHHEIIIRRVGNDAIPPQPMPIMHVDDTVRYSSDAGAVTVEFPQGSPFQEAQIMPGTTATVRNVGKFRCRCFIDLNGGKGRIGWTSDPSRSGADHDIRRN